MIVVSWGGLVYGVMRTSDALRLKWFLRPIYDGLLAMLIFGLILVVALAYDYQKGALEWD